MVRVIEKSFTIENHLLKFIKNVIGRNGREIKKIEKKFKVGIRILKNLIKIKGNKYTTINSTYNCILENFKKFKLAEMKKNDKRETQQELVYNEVDRSTE
ncbi:hypothetical protein FQA39_LY08462 [Lamprigera yunnana]|nr:hypothetical protein FQA39_LY08462 [Lamprigera yunnana]